MSSYCFDDKREKSTRGMAQECQYRVTLASTSRPPARRVLAAKLVLPGSLGWMRCLERSNNLSLPPAECEVHPDP
jgi:hypothetical protein